MTDVRQRSVASSRVSEASDAGTSPARSSRASEASPARKRFHMLFACFASAVFSVVYFAQLPLFWPYCLMLVQMAVELFAQPHLGLAMQVHHVANLGVTVLYLLWPTFDPIIREGLAVETATLLLTVIHLAGKRAGLLLKLSFGLSFFYTRFVVGGIRIADPAFVWAYGSDLPPSCIWFGWACLLVIHGCACFWSGQVVLQFVRAVRSSAFRKRAEPLAAVPFAAVGLCRGSPAVAAVACGLALATYVARSGGRFGAPRLSADERHALLLPRASRAVEVCLTMACSLVVLVESDSGGARAVGIVPLLLLHLAAACLVFAGDAWLYPDSQLSGAFAYVVAICVGGVDASCVVGRPPVHTLTMVTMLLVCASVLFQLRQQHALEYAPTLMHVMGAVLLYQGCHCVPGPTLPQLALSRLLGT